jgi:hypothetical protein
MTKYPGNNKTWPQPSAALPWDIGGKISANFLDGETPVVANCPRLTKITSLNQVKFTFSGYPEQDKVAQSDENPGTFALLEIRHA